MLTRETHATNRYFTVVHPWPGHLDLSLPGDGKKVGIYVASSSPPDVVNNHTDLVLDVPVASW